MCCIFCKGFGFGLTMIECLSRAKVRRDKPFWLFQKRMLRLIPSLKPHCPQLQ